MTGYARNIAYADINKFQTMLYYEVLIWWQSDTIVYASTNVQMNCLAGAKPNYSLILKNGMGTKKKRMVPANFYYILQI